jgi:tyrosyl-tRNA synthetase
MLAPIRADFEASPEFQEVQAKAYPVVEVKKVVKQKKDKGDPALRAAAQAKAKAAAAAKAAGASQSDIVAQPDGHIEGKDAEKVIIGPSSEELLKKLEVKDS